VKRVDSLRATPKRHRPKVGRPTGEQVSAINRSILELATALFVKHGYDGTSMDAVATAAGVSKGTLYSRYPDKEALFRKVVEERVAAWGADTSRRGVITGETLEQRLKQYAKLAILWAASPEVHAFDRLLAAARGIPEVARALYEARYCVGVEFLADEIRRFTAAEGRPARDPAKVAATLMAALAGWLRIECSVRVVPEREAVAFAHHTVELLMAGRSAW
jgi:TetR/AcrR family transcriptional repressor of mexJK operon